MNTSVKGSRPQGTDGSDFAFRQRLDPRYEIRAQIKSRLRIVLGIFWFYLGLNFGYHLGRTALNDTLN